MEHKQRIVKWIQLALLVGNALLFVFAQYAYAIIALVLVWVAVSELEFVSEVWEHKGKAKFDVKWVKKESYGLGWAATLIGSFLFGGLGFFIKWRVEKEGITGVLQGAIIVCIGLIVIILLIVAAIGIVKWIAKLNACYATRYSGKKRVR